MKIPSLKTDPHKKGGSNNMSHLNEKEDDGGIMAYIFI
jgi:hypothetical protein